MKSKELQYAIDAILKAGKIVSDNFRKVKTVKYKSSYNDIVTDVDYKSEKVIIDNLNKTTQYPIISEEGSESSAQYIDEKVWIIDSLDGTANYYRGIPFYSISIALVNKGEREIGVIYNPESGELYYAIKNKGAFLNEKRIEVSQKDTIKGSILFFDHGYKKTNAHLYSKSIEIVSPVCLKRSLGSTVLELCCVAQGIGDGYISVGDRIWDYSAGALLVDEAGGKVTDWKGGSLDPENPFILASNALIHNQLLKKFSKLQK